MCRSRRWRASWGWCADVDVALSEASVIRDGRAILAGIYSATLAVFVNDDSEGKEKTHEFLGRRIDGVMKFEKAKAQFLNKDREMPSLSRFLGRLRYPSR